MAYLSGFAYNLLFFSYFLLLFARAYGRGGSLGLSVSEPAAGICATSVTLHGYKCHEIQVQTKDGYLLSMQRIPQGRNNNNNNDAGFTNTNRPPVLIQHGVLVDGMTWLLNPREQNLPLILADEGFDVWLANTRGTQFSKTHISLQPSQPEFWNWSWDELVSYDFPAFFEYVYSQTGQKIHYIGHSLGTLIGLASFSEGLVADKVRSAAFLSPVAYLSHMNTPLGVIAAKSFVGEITTLFGLAEFNPKGEPVGRYLQALCAYPGVDCYDLLTAVTGPNCCLNSSTVAMFLKNEPQSTSTKNMVHLAQTVRDGRIEKYNYGRGDYNMMHYGETSPPLYNLSRIPKDLPLFISYGGRDALSDVKDVQLLLDHFKLHDVDKISIQYVKEYAHADFIMGTNAKDIVYNQVYSFFKRH